MLGRRRGRENILALGSESLAQASERIPSGNDGAQNTWSTVAARFSLPGERDACFFDCLVVVKLPRRFKGSISLPLSITHPSSPLLLPLPLLSPSVSPARTEDT